MKDFRKLRENVLKGKIIIDDLSEYKSDFKSFYYEVINKPNKHLIDDIYEFLMLCLDYYTYSNSGDVLIDDHEYDEIMNIYINRGNKPFYHADYIGNYTMWPFIKHEAPYMVGSVAKIYTKEELDMYLIKYRNLGARMILAPKYDGISACIRKENGRINYAITRADGVEGQDILEVVLRAKNPLTKSKYPDGYYKCELLVGQKDYNELIKYKNYANRRSATSAIVNSPKNLEYAKYMTVMPLAFTNDNGRLVKYIPKGMIETGNLKTSAIMDEIFNMLKVIRSTDFEYRTDGVVLFPINIPNQINSIDIMDSAVAYKVNTAIGLTRVDYPYISVGRRGKAIPMLKLIPVEVNETIVSDVSLGSFDKFNSLALHENEMVEVYSAGDVIPQVQLPEERNYPKKAEHFKLKMVCPYCNERLERRGAEYFCVNNSCIRVNSGRIINFIDKLGVENISDKTIETLYEKKYIRCIEDLFEFDFMKIADESGFGEISAINMKNEIDKLKTKPIQASQLLGALGIDKISTKKCKVILQNISLDEILEMKSHRLYDYIMNIEGFSVRTTEIFVDFIKENKGLIKYLMKNMNIIQDKIYYTNIVFTGIRSKEWEQKFRDIDVDISDNVNSETRAVVCASSNSSSSKIRAAQKKAVPIVLFMEIEDLYDQIKGEMSNL